MNTLPANPAPVKARDVFVLALSINGQGYDVQPIDAGEDGSKAFRLVKHKGDDCVYDLVRTHAGLVECSCPDYECRHRGLDCGMCKHGRCLVALGLLDAPRPVPPTPEPSRPGIDRVADEFDEPLAPAPLADLPRIHAWPDGATVDLDVFTGRKAASDRQDATTAAPTPCCPSDEPAPCMACADASTARHDDDRADDDEHDALIGHDTGRDEPADEDLDELPPYIGDDDDEDPDAFEAWRDEHADRLSMTDWLRSQIELYRLIGCDLADLVAESLEDLVSEVAITHAATPGQLRDRRAALGSRGDAPAREPEPVGSAFLGHDGE